MKSSILFINGSASDNSSNGRLIQWMANQIAGKAKLNFFNELKNLPHFDPLSSAAEPPAEVRNFRSQIEQASIVVFCTPEYIFSIPSGLKNALEWCVATTVFEKKKVAVVTASAHGEKGHAELQLILNTLGAECPESWCALVQGVKAKVPADAEITDVETLRKHRGVLAHLEM